MRNVAGAPGIENLTAAELRAFCGVCDRLAIEPDWLACVVSFETAGTFSPAQRNGWAVIDAQRKGQKYWGAIGLIQFMPSTMCALLGIPNTPENQHVAIEKFESMTVLEQLPYVERYLAPYKGRMKSLEDTYLAVFYPAAIGQPDGWVVASKDGSTLSNRPTSSDKERGRAQSVYRQNAGFDARKRGFITRFDICSTIRDVRDRAHKRARVGYVDPVEAPEVSGEEAARRGQAAVDQLLRDRPEIVDGPKGEPAT